MSTEWHLLLTSDEPHPLLAQLRSRWFAMNDKFLPPLQGDHFVVVGRFNGRPLKCNAKCTSVHITVAICEEGAQQRLEAFAELQPVTPDDTNRDTRIVA